MPEEASGTATSQKPFSARETFTKALETSTSEAATTPEVEAPVKSGYEIDEKLPPDERMEKLLAVDQDNLSPADLARLKKDIQKGFTQATQKHSKAAKDAEAQVAQLQAQLEPFAPLLELWQNDEGFRNQAIAYVQGQKPGAAQPSRTKSARLEKFLSDFAPEQQESLTELYDVIRQDVMENLKSDDPVARKRLEELESRLEVEQKTRITQDVERMEKRFHESCPTYKELPAFLQQQFELTLRSEFGRNADADPVEVYRAFEKELVSFSQKDRSKQLDELAARPSRVPPPPGSTSGSSELKFTPGKTAKEAFWHFMNQRAR